MVFARPPVEGRAKTRLARGVGVTGAHRIYRAMLACLFDRLARLPALRIEVHAAAQEGRDALEELVASRFPLKDQVSGDLGLRMEQALGQAHADGARGVVIGADSPDLPLSVLEDAFQALETHDVVLGPADDGGYFLIGSRSPLEGVLVDIPWSSGREFQATLDVLRRAGHSVAQVKTWYDIDDITDLERVRESARRAPEDLALQALCQVIQATQDPGPTGCHGP